MVRYNRETPKERSVIELFLSVINLFLIGLRRCYIHKGFRLISVYINNVPVQTLKINLC